VHPEVKNWIKYARFEDKHGYVALARRVYERAVEFFGEDYVEEQLFVAFSRFEEHQKEVLIAVFIFTSVTHIPELQPFIPHCTCIFFLSFYFV